MGRGFFVYTKKGELIMVENMSVNSQEDILRHTTAHIMAQAVLRLWPDTKVAIGPTIKNGFYYDFDLNHRFTPEDLEVIEQEMQKIVAEALPISREEISNEEAVKLFSEQNQDYKLELLEGLDSEVSLYRQGEFVDLCRGPHLENTSKVKFFKLQSIAGAYWRGDSSRPMLQRIYGTAFLNGKELRAHLRMLEEAAKRDHRMLGRKLDLYSIQDEGPGFPFFHPKGMVLRNELENYWREEHRKRGYVEIKTPIMLHEDLWHQSGHWDNYRDNMYLSKIDEQDFAIKPMNCPGAMLVYKRKLHSYRELPIRMAEMGLVHRHELSGTLHGLMRVRAFTQDDAHIFMLPSQIQEEIEGVIDFVDEVYNVFGFKYHVELSTKPDNAIGDDAIWEDATLALKEALEAKNLEYVINEGDGAFYGPKIDFHLEDSIGRTWQCATIQLDFAMPERFDLTYIDEDNERKRPVMIHRVLYGALERFMAILTEHTAGAFPTWLAPVQVQVIPVGDDYLNYANKVADKLFAQGIRVEVDKRAEKLGKKIREAQIQQIPYMLIVGEKEQESEEVSIRHRRKADLGSMSVDGFLDIIKDEIRKKENN
ncbi:MAG TPA: threonine--tRNA ligase [Natronincola sp.]|nr:threonine--tRNA ligase [Natronincola sp.]